MKRFILVLAIVASVLSHSTFDTLFSQDQLNSFDNCQAVGFASATPNIIGLAFLWNINASTNSITFVVSANIVGWVGIGISKEITLPGDQMFNTDVAIGFFDPLQGNFADVDDYFVGSEQTYCNIGFPVGVCRDTFQTTGVDNLVDTSLTFDNATSVITMQFTRPLNTGDSFDTVIVNATQQMLWAFNNLSPALVVDYHEENRGAFEINLFTSPPACPVAPNGKICNGFPCSKGCCICSSDAGFNCAVPPSGGSETVPTSIDKTDFPFSLKIDPNLVLNWGIDPVGQTVTIGLVCQCTGWVAFGPSPQSQMINTDAILGWINPDGSLDINDYLILDRQASAITLDVANGGTNDVLGSFGKQEGGTTTIIYRRKLVTGDSRDHPITSGTIGVVYGYNPTNPGPNLVEHLSNTKSPLSLNFFSGVGALSAGNPLYQAHGSLMFVIWYVTIPITSFIARYLKGQLGHAWFEIHRITNFIAMLMNLAAFIIAVVMTNDGHFNQYHKILGLIVFIFGTIQPILGTLADRLFDPNRERAPVFPDMIHWILGWLTLLIGLINIAFGLQYYGAIEPVQIAYWVIGSLMVLFLVVFAIVSKVTGFPAPPDHN